MGFLGDADKKAYKNTDDQDQTTREMQGYGLSSKQQEQKQEAQVERQDINNAMHAFFRLGRKRDARTGAY